MSDRSRIVDQLRRSLEAEPESIIFAALAEEYRRAGMHQQAIETARAGLARHPMYLSARVTLGRALIATGEFKAAREALTEVLASAPQSLAAIRALADIHDPETHADEMEIHAIETNASDSEGRDVDSVLAWEMSSPSEATELHPPPPTPPPPALRALERFLRGVQGVRRQRSGTP